MSGSDDETPPTSDTIPAPAPANDAEAEPLVIPAGHAQEALSAALDDLARAFVRVEATSMALARQLDAQAVPEGP
jgi:hypothetical protein